MERSFKAEVAKLRLGAGQTFNGEGILAVTKALLQSGVSYVGGYQGAPVSHLMDVLADARELLDELGVHFESCANEAGAAAMLGASINYPLRGAATWKSVVGTNVASDALSNLASAGVVGGTLIVIGEDYGEGASIIQERSHAFAQKSQVWLLDPRPNLPSIVRMVEKGFELSEASNTPVMLELRIRACHVHGSFETRDNVAPRHSRRNPVQKPVFSLERIPLPPHNYTQEKHKIAVRLPEALKFIRREQLNELFAGELRQVGIVLQGGMYNTTIRALQQLGLADAYGASRVPLYVLNVTYPLLPEEITRFCTGKRAVLVVEEGQPAHLEEAINAILRRADINDPHVVGKDVLPVAGEYTGEVVLKGVGDFLRLVMPDGVDLKHVDAVLDGVEQAKKRAAELLGMPVPTRPPGFCVGCPERPVFSALKLIERELGGIHISSDIGCHTFSTLPPFNLGNTVLGYGLSLAAASAVGPNFGKRVVTVMGDGGFWHQGLVTGVANAVFRNDDGVLIIMQNGYTSATGTQNIASSPDLRPEEGNPIAIENTLRGLGVKWLERVNNYEVASVADALRRAMTAPEKGLKVIIADGECMLERTRRERPIAAQKLAAGERVVRTRFGIDDDVCTGDRACIRLSGCPSLTIKDSPDPLRTEPVTTVDSGCVGCGLCGEAAHAAGLCPSFHRIEVIQNPSGWDRFMHGIRQGVIGMFGGAK
ncbi:MAG: indolepyruvate ferredoxin oxidoreductase [Rhodocyclaceae bacterium]|nr:MAG: indolepyruvate ferredoxin oxidoreductase [Betaproteobacteria bacterium]GJQ55109.1 MAG: indolepyruvate ferredoxin oxidoreductase [Rhodocyclaceae bacterium]